MRIHTALVRRGLPGKEASPGGSVHRYARHRPERTLLYRVIDEYYPAFVAELAAEGRQLPVHVQREFEDYLKNKRGWIHFLTAGAEKYLKNVPGPFIRKNGAESAKPENNCIRPLYVLYSAWFIRVGLWH